MPDHSLRQGFKGPGHHQIGVGSVAHLLDEHLLAEFGFLQALGELEVFDPVEQRDNFLVRAVIQGTQKRRQKKLPAPLPAIQMDIEQVRGVVSHLQPGTPVGDNPVAVKDFAVGMNAGLKTDARRTMQLADNGPFRAVDDEGSLPGHQGQFAHVNPLLDRRPLVMEGEGHVKGRRIGHPFPQTLDRTLLGLAQLIVAEVEFDFLVVRFDRENLAEHGLKAVIFPIFRDDALLQEGPVGVQLDLDKIRHLHRFGQPPEIDPLYFCHFRHAVLFSYPPESREDGLRVI